MTDPDTIASAVLRHIEETAPPLPPPPMAFAPGELDIEPTDAEIFGCVPTALPEEITRKIVRGSLRDEDWENETTAATRVPYDPTGCMM
jgi:hypothetical protein